MILRGLSWAGCGRRSSNQFTESLSPIRDFGSKKSLLKVELAHRLFHKLGSLLFSSLTIVKCKINL